MKVRKAVITAAGRDQRALPLQTLVDRDGNRKSILEILVEEVLRAHVDDICVVVWPGDAERYGQAAGSYGRNLRFISQSQPLGYGHAVFCARSFVGQDPFLHLVGDHLYVNSGEKGCAQHLVEVAESEASAVSAVQATRESLLPRFGAVAARRIPERPDLYRIETVLEKPTPTESEQKLIISGLRSGYYLCFFGMHVLTPAVMEILGDMLSAGPGEPVMLSAALAALARREQYLALEKNDRRYDMGAKYGLLTAQLALALSGHDRNEVLSQLLELLALRDTAVAGR